jgi:Transposase DDE domain
MFIREVKKKNSKNGKIFHQFTLAQNSRVNGKVVQSSILSLGSDIELLNIQTRNDVLLLLKEKILGQKLILPIDNQTAIVLANKYYEKFLIKFKDLDPTEVVSKPPKHDGSDYQEVDVASIDVVSSKSFGSENITSLMYDELGFNEIFSELKWSSEQIIRAKLSIVSRAVFCASEHKTAQILTDNSALYSILDMDKHLSHRDLYPVLDDLNLNQEKIENALYFNLKNIFNIDQTIVIYDISNAYFEGRKVGSELAKFGRNKQKRNDCRQVVFTGIIDNKGFIRHSKIYQGNMADCKTIVDLLNDFEKQGIDVQCITLVIDAGFATEENLKLISEKNIKYVCVARDKIKDFEINYTSKIVEVIDNQNNKIQLQNCKHPKKQDNWMYVKSEQKRLKENSMSGKLEQRFEDELKSINEGLSRKRTVKDLIKISERIGRIKEKNKLVSGRYKIEIIQKDNIATAINFTKNTAVEITNKSEGVYFIRTNYQDIHEKKLWEIYNIIRDVEATFRSLKSDLLIRPIHHKKDQRIEGHIFQTILAYQIVNAIRVRLKAKEINHDWQNIKRILNTQTANLIELPTKTKKLTISKISKPIKEVQEIYNILNYKTDRKTKKVHVVYH